jgi:hypothetical protein
MGGLGMLFSEQRQGACDDAPEAVARRDAEAWLRWRFSLYERALDDLEVLVTDCFTGETARQLRSTLERVTKATADPDVPDGRLPVREVRIVFESTSRLVVMPRGFLKRRVADRVARDWNVLERRTPA